MGDFMGTAVMVLGAAVLYAALALIMIGLSIQVAQHLWRLVQWIMHLVSTRDDETPRLTR